MQRELEANKLELQGSRDVHERLQQLCTFLICPACTARLVADRAHCPGCRHPLPRAAAPDLN